MSTKVKRSFQEFIQVMSERNNYQYDYSLVSEKDYYKYGSDRLIPIICNIHGEVMVHQGKHASIRGCKCPKCIEDTKLNRSSQAYDAAKIKQEANIELLKTTLYGNTDLYLIWMDEQLSIHIDCVVHGTIRIINRYQSYMDLSNVSQKCTHCRNERLAIITAKKKQIALARPQKKLREKLELMSSLEPHAHSFAELIEDVSCSTRDTNRYSYSYDHEYLNKLFKSYKVPEKIQVICNKHGPFTSILSSHIEGKSNCQICAGIARISKEDCFNRFNAVHGQRFDYSKFKFVSMNKKSIIKCIKHNHWFKTSASNHLLCESSGGCKKCQTSGFDPSKPGTLYYLSINNGSVYKIGITNFTVKKRFLKDPTLNYKVIAAFEFENGQDAFNKELEIKRQYKHAQYKGEPIMLSGNTELFTYDILGLDT